MADLKETCIERVFGDEYCTVYTGERKFINRLKKYKEEHPDQVKIIEYDETTNSMLAHVPESWFKFVGPKKKGRTFTEEERQKISARFKKKGENE